MSVHCKCGWRCEGIEGDRKMAEVIADRHESGDARRAYRHDTLIVTEGVK